VPSRFINDEPPAADGPGGAGPAGRTSASDAATAAATPNWFCDFLIDRATRKPSAHTLKAYREDFTAVADLLTSGCAADVAFIDITKDNMRAAFAAYASTHEPASIRRCWSTWNVLCDSLYTAELIPANPMPFVARPKAAKTLPRSLPQPAVTALLEAIDGDHESPRRTDWPERDPALMLTGMLAGLRADELRRADVGDIRTGTDGGAVLHVRGKGSKDRAVPIEADLLSVIEAYLDSRASRLPATLTSSTGKGLSRWAANTPLFVGRDGTRCAQTPPVPSLDAPSMAASATQPWYRRGRRPTGLFDNDFLHERPQSRTTLAVATRAAPNRFRAPIIAPVFSWATYLVSAANGACHGTRHEAALSNTDHDRRE
jgi:site-specific recombinase XerC